jgi:Immunity protein 31
VRLGFYEKVKIIRSEALPEHVGKTGIVTGISEDDTKIYGYTVFFLDEGENCYFHAEDLEGTGEFVDKGLLYDENAHVRVRVIDGKGSIVD